MNMTGNTILITGAGSGIGLALAEEFVALDNEVIVAARSRGKRDAAERRGLKTIVAVMPHLLKQRSAAILIVSSGLAFVPSAFVPSYSATKAALHSYAQSLRFQLRQTSIQVIEIAPPYVQTELGGRSQATDPNAMPLRDFISEVIQILKSVPHVEEVLVKRVLPHRYAAEHGRENYDAFFEKYHSRVM